MSRLWLKVFFDPRLQLSSTPAWRSCDDNSSLFGLWKGPQLWELGSSGKEFGLLPFQVVSSVLDFTPFYYTMYSDGLVLFSVFNARNRSSRNY